MKEKIKIIWRKIINYCLAEHFYSPYKWLGLGLKFREFNIGVTFAYIQPHSLGIAVAFWFAGALVTIRFKKEVKPITVNNTY